MDILDFFWTFYLNHLSPLWGYFSPHFDLKFWTIDKMTLETLVEACKGGNKTTSPVNLIWKISNGK